MSKPTSGKAAPRTPTLDKAGPRPASRESSESYRRIKTASSHSGRVLHDEVGPLLSAAGLHLQLLRMDHPATGVAVQEVIELLDQAIERIRAISQELAPSPVLRGGLKNALTRLVEKAAEQNPEVAVKLDYLATAAISEELACALFEAAEGVIVQAVGLFGAARVKVSVRGSRSLSIRISDNGRTRGRLKALGEIRRTADASGIFVTISTRKSTIVLIRYALRRSSGRRS
jgi:signal transduction histidine kinase